MAELQWNEEKIFQEIKDFVVNHEQQFKQYPGIAISKEGSIKYFRTTKPLNVAERTDLNTVLDNFETPYNYKLLSSDYIVKSSAEPFKADDIKNGLAMINRIASEENIEKVVQENMEGLAFQKRRNLETKMIRFALATGAKVITKDTHTIQGKDGKALFYQKARYLTFASPQQEKQVRELYQNVTEKTKEWVRVFNVNELTLSQQNPIGTAYVPNLGEQKEAIAKEAEKLTLNRMQDVAFSYEEGVPLKDNRPINAVTIKDTYNYGVNCVSNFPSEPDKQKEYVQALDVANTYVETEIHKVMQQQRARDNTSLHQSPLKQEAQRIKKAIIRRKPANDRNRGR